jgi:hypothetical protein
LKADDNRKGRDSFLKVAQRSAAVGKAKQRSELSAGAVVGTEADRSAEGAGAERFAVGEDAPGPAGKGEGGGREGKVGEPGEADLQAPTGGHGGTAVEEDVEPVGAEIGE